MRNNMRPREKFYWQYTDTLENSGLMSAWSQRIFVRERTREWRTADQWEPEWILKSLLSVVESCYYLNYNPKQRDLDEGKTKIKLLLSLYFWGKHS